MPVRMTNRCDTAHRHAALSRAPPRSPHRRAAGGGESLGRVTDPPSAAHRPATFRCVRVSRALAAGTAHQARRHTHVRIARSINSLVFGCRPPATCAGRRKEPAVAAALHARLAQSCALCRASLPIAALVMSFVRRELTPRFRHRAGAAASRYTEGDPRCRSRPAAARTHATVASLSPAAHSLTCASLCSRY